MPGGDDQRSAAFSAQLRQAHQALRDQLRVLRAELGGGPAAPAELRLHCLAFCSTLTTHHQGEDEGLFGALLSARPDLAPAVAKLTEDHAAMAAILRQVRELADRARETPAAGLPALQRELDGLTAITESHFRYEERAIGAALDGGVTDTGWSAPVFRPSEATRRP